MTNTDKRRIMAELNTGLELPLLRTLKNGRRPFNRAAAAYAMQMLSSPKTITALERTLTNNSEHPLVRGVAAEALAHYHRRTSHRVLRNNLCDASKHVRFWCAFALGEMVDKEAVVALEHLALTDKRVVPGFHSVAKEAADALQEIRNGKGRCPWCARA